MTCFVYFLQAGENGPVKIGFTTSLVSRLNALQAGHILSVIRLIEGGKQTERWLHERFSDVRRAGEWFEFHPEMLTITPPPELPGRSNISSGYPGAPPDLVAEMTGIIREAMLPVEPGEQIRALLHRAADRLGVKYARVRAYWYKIVRLVPAAEAEHFRAAIEALRFEKTLAQGDDE